MDIQRINPSEKWSDVTVFNKMAHFVEVAEDETVDMLGQTEQVFAQAEAMLASVNSDKSRLVSVIIYVTDFANLAVFNEAWIKWLPEGCAPSRACLKVELVDPNYLVEIAFVAAVK
ncbi:RidA family protein [Aliivibrio fischeri]|uniref:RidA family protein n=1 Tax=Aliivibrio fischeri TaxID=668 RepID=UPI0012D90999|nr:RidA family protein [Aliivibrio fischeri]MUI56062.1 RidA family protein [Aliivibrio fischeri]